jgi:hypothetical protein
LPYSVSYDGVNRGICDERQMTEEFLFRSGLMRPPLMCGDIFCRSRIRGESSKLSILEELNRDS